MKHAIQRYPEVSQNQEFLNLVLATLTGPSHSPLSLCEVCTSHRGGTITAYLHSNLDLPCRYSMVSPSDEIAQAVSNRTGLFCDCNEELILPEPVHTVVGLNLPEFYLGNEEALRSTVQMLLQSATRAVLLTSCISRCALGLSYSPTELKLLHPTHSFLINSTTMVLAWFK